MSPDYRIEVAVGALVLALLVITSIGICFAAFSSRAAMRASHIAENIELRVLDILREAEGQDALDARTTVDQEERHQVSELIDRDLPRGRLSTATSAASVADGETEHGAGRRPLDDLTPDPSSLRDPTNPGTSNDLSTPTIVHEEYLPTTPSSRIHGLYVNRNTRGFSSPTMRHEVSDPPASGGRRYWYGHGRLSGEPLELQQGSS